MECVPDFKFRSRDPDFLGSVYYALDSVPDVRTKFLSLTVPKI